MENIDNNPLYEALLTKFRKEFETACRLSYLIVIPHSNSLENVAIDKYLVNSHIMIPSKLLKMHFTPLQTGFCDDVEIDGNILLVNCRGQTKTIDILYQEVGYNIHNKEYKMIIINQLLMDLSSKSYKLSASELAKSLTNIKPPKRLVCHDDCRRYLESISDYTTVELETDVKRLQSNYMILSHYLDDAALRVKSLTEVYIKKYEDLILNRTKVLTDYEIHSIQVAVENYVIHLLHGKLMVSFYKLYDEKDKLLAQKLNEIYNANLSLEQLGAQHVFAEYIASDSIINELSKLSYLQSPLAIVSCLTKLADLINDSLKESVNFKVLIGDVNTTRDTITICSDDLIASFVYSLAIARPPRLYSVAKYLEQFGWSSTARDQAAYYTATFQIVVQYMLSYTKDQPVQDRSLMSSHLTLLEGSKGNLNDKQLNLTTIQEEENPN